MSPGTTFVEDAWTDAPSDNADQIAGSGIVARDLSNSIIAGRDVNISALDAKELAKEIIDQLHSLGIGPQVEIEAA